MGEACKRDPGKHGKVNPIVAVERLKSLYFGADCPHRCLGIRHEPGEFLLVVEIGEGETLIGKQDCGAAVNDVVNQNLIVAQAVFEGLNFIGDAKCEVMIGQRRANFRTCFQDLKHLRDFKLGADVEIGILVSTKKLEQIAPRPGGDIEKGWHARNCSVERGHNSQFRVSRSEFRVGNFGVISTRGTVSGYLRVNKLPIQRLETRNFPRRVVTSMPLRTIPFPEDEHVKIALASDHAGFSEKEKLKTLLNELGLDVADLGTVSEASVDYPDYARKVAEEVAQGRVDQGLLVCGSGTGMAITANKVAGVRAAVAWSEETARLARQHNDANVLAIGARTTPPEEIPKIVRAWFSTNFEGGRHAERVRKIRNVESSQKTLG